MHELFVELAQAGSIRKVDGVQPAIGNRPAGDDSGHPRCTLAGQQIVDTVPRDSRLELRRDVRRIFAGEHRQHFVERAARQSVVRIRSPNEIEQVAAFPIVHRHRRDDHLRQYIERILHDVRRLDVPARIAATIAAISIASSRNVGTSIPRLGDAERVAGTPDALQRGGDTLR